MARSTDLLKRHLIPKERVERAARLYRSAKDASLALGIMPSSFRRLCQQYGIETPHDRKKRAQRDRKVST